MVAEKQDVPRLYSLLNRLIAPLIRRYARIDIQGAEFMPTPSAAALMASNHPGHVWWDSLCLASVFGDRHLRFVAHHWDASIGPLRYFLTHVGALFLEKDPDAISSEDPVVRALGARQLVCQYPEESYHCFRDRYTLFRFAPHVIRYAELSGTMITPVAMIGVEEAAPCFFGVKRPGVPLHVPLHPPVILPLKVTVVFGEPVSAQELQDGGSTGTLPSWERGAQNLQHIMLDLMSRFRKARTSSLRYLDHSTWV